MRRLTNSNYVIDDCGLTQRTETSACSAPRFVGKDLAS